MSTYADLLAKAVKDFPKSYSDYVVRKKKGFVPVEQGLVFETEAEKKKSKTMPSLRSTFNNRRP